MSAETERTFDFSRYAEAVEKQQRLIGEANEVQRQLDQANSEVAAEEERMQEALDMSLAEIRIYVKREDRAHA